MRYANTPNKDIKVNLSDGLVSSETLDNILFGLKHNTKVGEIIFNNCGFDDKDL